MTETETLTCSGCGNEYDETFIDGIGQSGSDFCPDCTFDGVQGDAEYDAYGD